MDTPHISRRQFLRRSGLASTGGALASVVSLGLDPQRVREATVPLDWKIARTSVVPSICPYCAVGCSILLHVRDGKLVNLEGNPDSPINRGTLCPKGAASYQLTVNPHRPTQCLYRRPGAPAWEPIALDRAMDMVAERVRRTRDATFQRTIQVDGRDVTVNNTMGIGSLGGATIDNEWNYAQAKMWRGLGGVFIENQARI
ncbi:MAG TPA: twin-arginine translocation signal domain-containing protein [Gemmatimonadales bacterium]|nr:twin-arginine translocation signal domain-containing protein [Gemmatimonadales bacterium]